MINTWFIGDTHFFHKNILTFGSDIRLFKDVNEMNEAIIERWNNVVKTQDKVYCLGDMVFGKGNLPILSRLNGNKHLIMGNHDTYSAHQYLKYFVKVFGAIEWKGCILSHIPVHPTQLAVRYTANIHGHLHTKTLADNRYINVSCEQNNLTPIHVDVIKERIKLIYEEIQ